MASNKVLNVCIGDQVLLTNKLVGTVEFIGSLHDFNQIPFMIENDNNDNNDNDEENDDNEDSKDQDDDKEDKPQYDIKYGIVIDLKNYDEYPSCLDKDRNSKHGKINNVQRIPMELFKDNKNESIFVGIDEIQYICKRIHNFRVGINEEYIMPSSFGTIYGECVMTLKYCGYLCSHKRKTNDDGFFSFHGKLQNYYLGFMVKNEYKSKIDWDWDNKVLNIRWCRLYPQDSRRYIHHRFNAPLDSIRPRPNDDIVVFINLHEWILLNKNDINNNNDDDDLYLYEMRRKIALFYNEIKRLPKLNDNEKITFISFLESVLLRYWQCIDYSQNIMDINSIIIDYIEPYLTESILYQKCDIITKLYKCKFIDRLLLKQYGFSKLCILDNVTLKEIIYKNEKSLLHPWIEGHVFDTKLWLKTQWNNADGYRAIIPAFKYKFQCNTNINEQIEENKDGVIKHRCGMRRDLLIIVYRFKQITIILLWQPQNKQNSDNNNEDNNDSNDDKRGFSIALQNMQLRKVVNKKRNKNKKKSNKEQKEEKEKEENAFPTRRYEVFQSILDFVLNPMNEYFEDDL